MPTVPTRAGRTGRPARPRADGRRSVVVTAALADLLVVVLFVVAGRRTHRSDGVGGDLGGLLTGAAATAWPFVVALAAGWLLARAWRSPLSVRRGAVVWLTTVLGGLLLRAAVSDAPAPAFVVVTVAVLAAGLVGWRAVAALVRRGR